MRYSIKFETIGFNEYHICFPIYSILCYSPSEIFQIVKNISATKLFKKCLDLKKRIKYGEFLNYEFLLKLLE